jgi:PAS domain S-box-containing protein
MANTANWIEKRQHLRTEAEALVAQVSAPTPAAPPADVLLHELLVHKIELEMQIDELQRAQTSIEATRDHYANRYELAPVGLVTVSRQGLIEEINLTGAAMFGVDRARLIGTRFSLRIAPQDADDWHRRFMAMIAPDGAEKSIFALTMIAADAAALSVLINCQRLGSDGSPPLLSCALIDVTRIGWPDRGNT